METSYKRLYHKSKEMMNIKLKIYEVNNMKSELDKISMLKTNFTMIKKIKK